MAEVVCGNGWWLATIMVVDNSDGDGECRGN